MKSLLTELYKAARVADINGHTGRLGVTPTYFDIDMYPDDEKHTGRLICSERRFAGYDLVVDPRIVGGYGISLVEYAPPRENPVDTLVARLNEAIEDARRQGWEDAQAECAKEIAKYQH